MDNLLFVTEQQAYASVAGKGLEGLAVVAPGYFGVVPAVVGIERNGIVGGGCEAAGNVGFGRYYRKIAGSRKSVNLDVLFHCLCGHCEGTVTVGAAVSPIEVVVGVVAPSLAGFLAVAHNLGVVKADASLVS